MPKSQKPRKKYTPKVEDTISQQIADQLSLPLFLSLNQIKKREASETDFHQVAAVINLGLVLINQEKASATFDSFKQAAQILNECGSFEKLNELSVEAFDVLENAVLIGDQIYKRTPQAVLAEAIDSIIVEAGIE